MMIKSEVLNEMRNRNCLVTGGTGLIGRQVVELLLSADACVTVVSLDDIKIPNTTHRKIDLCDFSKCMEVTSDMDYVFHVAGIKGSVEVTKEQPASFLVPLLMMNTNILEASRINRVCNLVYTSSIGAYASAEVFVEGENEEGAPMDSYPGMAKRIAEQQVMAYRIQYHMNNFSIVRPANVYGPGDNFDPQNAMVIPSLMARIKSGENPMKIWGDGSAVRDFAYSRDIAEGIIHALYYGTNSSYVNLGSGIGYTIKELVETLQKVTDFSYEFDTSKSSGFPKRVMNIDRARKLIHYEPSTSLVDGLRETWDWFVANSSESKLRKNYFIGA